jgi:hypothetical protein
VQLYHVLACRLRVQPSTFCVTRVKPGIRRSSSARALCPGSASAASFRRHSYHSQTRRGSPANALGGRKFMRMEAGPEPGLGLAEGRYPALGRYAGAGQRDDMLSAAEDRNQPHQRNQPHWKMRRPRGARPSTAWSSFFAPSTTDTSRSSPEVISRTVQTPRSSSSSPRMAA